MSAGTEPNGSIGRISHAATPLLVKDFGSAECDKADEVDDETEDPSTVGLGWFCPRYCKMFCGRRTTDRNLEHLIGSIETTRGALKISSFDQYRILDNVKSILQNSKIRMQISHVAAFTRYFRFLAFIESILFLLIAAIATVLSSRIVILWAIFVIYVGFFIVTVVNTAFGSHLQAKSVTSLMHTFMRATDSAGHPKHINFLAMAHDENEQRKFFLYNAESILNIQQTLFDYRKLLLTQAASFSAVLFSVVNTADATNNLIITGIMWALAVVVLIVRYVEFVVLFDTPDLLVFNYYIYKARHWLTENSIAFVTSVAPSALSSYPMKASTWNQRESDALASQAAH
jgi:hypothetical protein